MLLFSTKLCSELVLLELLLLLHWVGKIETAMLKEKYFDMVFS